MRRSPAAVLRYSLAILVVVGGPAAVVFLLGTPELALPSEWADARARIDDGSFPDGYIVDIVSGVLLLGWIASLWFLVLGVRKQDESTSDETGLPITGGGMEPDEPWYRQGPPIFDEPFNDEYPRVVVPPDDTTPDDGPQDSVWPPVTMTADAGDPLDMLSPEVTEEDMVSDAEIIGGSYPDEPPMIVPVRAYYFTRAEDTLRSVSAQFLHTPRRWQELRSLNAASPGVAAVGPDTLLPTGTALALPGDPLPWGNPDPVYLWTLAEKFLYTAWGREPTPEEVVPFWRGLTSGTQLGAGAPSVMPEPLAAPAEPTAPGDFESPPPPVPGMEPPPAPADLQPPPPVTPPEYESPPLPYEYPAPPTHQPPPPAYEYPAPQPTNHRHPHTNTPHPQPTNHRHPHTNTPHPQPTNHRHPHTNTPHPQPTNHPRPTSNRLPQSPHPHTNHPYPQPTNHPRPTSNRLPQSPHPHTNHPYPQPTNHPRPTSNRLPQSPHPHTNHPYPHHTNHPHPRTNHPYPHHTNHPHPRTNHPYPHHTNHPHPRTNHPYPHHTNHPHPRTNHPYPHHTNHPYPHTNHPYPHHTNHPPPWRPGQSPTSAPSSPKSRMGRPRRLACRATCRHSPAPSPLDRPWRRGWWHPRTGPWPAPP